MTSERARSCNYQILVILAATMVDVGARSPTAAAAAVSSSASDLDGVAGHLNSNSSSSSSNSNHNNKNNNYDDDDDDNGLVVARSGDRRTPSAGRLFIDSDMIMQFAMHNVQNLPKPLQGPAMFAMGFSQQNMKNFMSTVRSLGQMLISSLVMMAVKRLFFADLKTEADRNKASGLTDAILNIVNVLNF